MEARKVGDLWDSFGMGSERKVRQQQVFCYRGVDETEGIGLEEKMERGRPAVNPLLPWPSL